MSKSVGICRTLFLAFFGTIIHNSNLSIGANALTYIIGYFLPPLLSGVLVSRKGVGCMEFRLVVILPYKKTLVIVIRLMSEKNK